MASTPSRRILVLVSAAFTFALGVGVVTHGTLETSAASVIERAPPATRAVPQSEAPDLDALLSVLRAGNVKDVVGGTELELRAARPSAPVQKDRPGVTRRALPWASRARV